MTHFLVDLYQLQQCGGHREIDASVTERDLELESSECGLRNPATFSVRIRMDGERVRVEGQVHAGLSLLCCRCVEVFDCDVAKEFSVDYWPDPVVPDGSELNLGYRDLSVGFYRDERLDLRGILAEQILFDVPMKPVCDPSCRGLCPTCGANRNGSVCDCKDTWLDPRWAALADLKRI